MATDPQPNGWTQYQKLVLAELERHEKQMENVKHDILEIKIAQNKLSSDIGSLQKSVDTLSERLKEASAQQTEKDKEALEQQAEKDKEALEQRIDVRELKLKFGWLCALIGLISGGAGSSIAEWIMRLFGH